MNVKKIKNILHNIVPPLTIIVSGIIATLTFTLDTNTKVCNAAIEDCEKINESNKKLNANIIQTISCLQIALAVVNQVYSKLMKSSEDQLKKDVSDKDTLISELSSNSGRSSIDIPFNNNPQRIESNESINNEPYTYNIPSCKSNPH